MNEVLHLSIVKPPNKEPIRTLATFDLMDDDHLRDIIYSFLITCAPIGPADPELLKELKLNEARTINEGRLVAVQVNNNDKDHDLISLQYLVPRSNE